MSASIQPIGVRYTIADSTTIGEVVQELQLLTESACFTLEDCTEQLPKALPALYALRQSSGLLDALEGMLRDAATLEALRAKSA